MWVERTEFNWSKMEISAQQAFTELLPNGSKTQPFWDDGYGELPVMPTHISAVRID
jgi:hypothetical protein